MRRRNEIENDDAIDILTRLPALTDLVLRHNPIGRYRRRLCLEAPRLAMLDDRPTDDHNDGDISRLDYVIEGIRNRCACGYVQNAGR